MWELILQTDVMRSPAHKFYAQSENIVKVSDWRWRIFKVAVSAPDGSKTNSCEILRWLNKYFSRRDRAFESRIEWPASRTFPKSDEKWRKCQLGISRIVFNSVNRSELIFSYGTFDLYGNSFWYKLLFLSLKMCMYFEWIDKCTISMIILALPWKFEVNYLGRYSPRYL